jgi:hypothetical protein
VPDFTADQLAIAVAVVAVVAILAGLLSLALGLRIRKLRREYAVLRGDGGERDIFGALGHVLRRTEALGKRVESVARAQADHAAAARHALQRFALVRYDAFEDMGGMLSFSAALLDDHGDGIVITSINGRTETRTYAKPVRELASEHNLSDEEREAIAAALDQAGTEPLRAPASSSL